MYKLLNKYKLSSIHIMVIILGFTGILGKLVLEAGDINVSNLVWYRMFFAFVTLFIFLVWKKQILNIPKKDILPLLGIGSIVALHWIFFFGAIDASNVSVALICMSTSSLFSAFLEPIFYKRKILFYEIIFGLIAILALSFMSYDTNISNNNDYSMGYIYGIISAFLGTLFTILNGKYIQKLDAAKITMVEMLGGVITVTAYLIYLNDLSVFTNTITTIDLTYILILATLCTAGIFVWMTELMRYIKPYSLIMAINLEPIYSIILAVIIFGDSEEMDITFYIGGTIILSLVFLDTYLKNKNSKK